MKLKPEWRKKEVSYEDRKMVVFYPDSGDRIETRDLEQFAEEKTLDDLRKQPPREKRKHSKQEVVLALKDYKKFKERGKKYF